MIKFSREEIEKIPVEEQKKAFEIVYSIIHNEANFVDNYYSGDKDTLFEARDIVAEKLKISKDQINFENESLKEEFDKLVEYGKNFKIMDDMLLKYIKNAYY